MKLFIAGASIALAVAAMAAPVAHGATAVEPTKSSVASWIDMASKEAMTTRATSFENSTVTCTIDASQASDCIVKIPGNSDRQTVTNADASRQWFRDLPSTKWNTNKFAAGVNPVSDVDRFYSYNPYTPWTADSGLGVKWSMKQVGRNIVINSSIANPGDDQAPRTTIIIASNGDRFSIIGKGRDGTVLEKTSGVMKAVTVTIPPSGA
jgi:hypothetical protein